MNTAPAVKARYLCMFLANYLNSTVIVLQISQDNHVYPVYDFMRTVATTACLRAALIDITHTILSIYKTKPWTLALISVPETPT